MVSSPMVICPSCIASSRALWTLAGARLISSASRTLVTIGPGPDVEGAGRRAVDLRAGQVGGEQVGGELDPAEGEVEGPRQGADGPGLGQAGDPLDQDVAPRQQRDDQPLQQWPLADDGGLEPLDQVREPRPAASVGIGEGPSADMNQ